MTTSDERRTAMGEARLRLRAEDADDLTIIAACLQDAAVRVSDMTYLPRRRRFAVVLNRYRWEAEAAGGVSGRRGQRVRTGLHFDGVLGVRRVGFEQSDGDRVLELLTIACAPSDEGACLTMVFAGEAAVELSVECIDAILHDLTAPWETEFRPEHFLDRGPSKRGR